jgi:hypothetical protein
VILNLVWKQRRFENWMDDGEKNVNGGVDQIQVTVSQPLVW